MNTSEVLNKAADQIEERGWAAKPNGVWHGGGDCASNTISRITGRLGLEPNAPQRSFWEYLGGTRPRDIYTWNDTPGRTATEVVEALRACAVIEAAKETADERESVAVA